MVAIRLWRLALFYPLCHGFQQSHHGHPLRQKLVPLRVFFGNDASQQRPIMSDAAFDELTSDTDIETLMKKQTLYEILGASPKDSTQELKRNYYRMAKLCHPDSQIGDDDVNFGTDLPEFQDVVDAWRVLGDPDTRKKYDRKLKAETFVKDTAKKIEENVSKVRPAVNAVTAVVEKVAVPFLRRTTATTWAVAQVAGKKIEEDVAYGTGNFNDGMKDVLETGQQVTQAIDSLELMEKAASLDKRAANEVERANQIADKLAGATEKRLFATLRSPKFALSSEEAFQVLATMDHVEEEQAAIEGTLTYGNPVIRDSFTEDNISALQEAEMMYADLSNKYSEIDEQFSILKQELELAEIAELRARYTLERAQAKWEEATANVVSASNKINDMNFDGAKTTMENVSTNLTKKQHDVRLSLLQKAQELLKVNVSEPVSDEELAELRRKEIGFIVEHEQVEARVDKLRERAAALRKRATAMDYESIAPELPFYKKDKALNGSTDDDDEPIMRPILTDLAP